MTQAPRRDDTDFVAGRLRAALEAHDLSALGALLHQDVRWGGPEDTPETCHSRSDVLDRLARQLAAGVATQVAEVLPGDGAILLGLQVKRPVQGGFGRERAVYQVLSVRDRLIVDIRGYPSRAEAARQAGLADGEGPVLEARALIPILNVSSLSASFAWFAKLGWAKRWDWREPDGTPTFGAVGSGGWEIFLCLDGQGGRGRDDGVRGSDQGMWLAVWVDDVDLVYAVCRREGLEVLRPPQDEPWGVRELHVRHPDGHVLRLSQGLHTH